MKAKRVAQKTDRSKPNQKLEEFEVNAWLQNFGLGQDGASEALQQEIEQELKNSHKKKRSGR